MKIKIYKELNEKLNKEWKHMWDSSNNAHFFNSPEWFEVNLQTYKYKKILIVTAYENNSLVGVLPLVQSKVFGISVYSDANNFFSEKSSILVINNSTKILNSLVNIAFQESNLLLRELSKEVVCNLEAEGARRFSYISSVCPCINLEGNPFSYLSKKQKSKIRNKIEKNSEISHRVVRNTGLKELKLMKKIEERSFKRVSGKSILNNCRNWELYTNLMKKAGKFLRLDIVEWGGNEIAYGLGLTYKKSYLACSTAFDKSYANLSPGKVLLYFLLKDLNNEEKRFFDFARGYSVLKKEFTDQFVLQYDTYLVKSKYVYLYVEAINFLRRVKALIINKKTDYDNLYLFKTK